MSDNYKFFSNRECEYFPCHSTDDTDNFNCLFCYCPLFALGENCGGSFTYLEDGTKDCSGCIRPHLRESYDYIVGRWDEVKELARRK